MTETLVQLEENFAAPSSGKTSKIKNNPTEAWEKLAHTGFNTELQVQKLVREYSEGLKNGQNRVELLTTWLDQTEQDYRGFVAEYLRQGMVLPNPLEFAEIDGQERIKGTSYGDRPLLECISKEERFGSVWDAVESAEQFLLQKKPGSLAFFTSPKGWSGYQREGRDIAPYKYSETFVFQVTKDKKLQALTFVTDIEFDHNKELLKQFGYKEQDFSQSLNEKEKLADLNSKIVTLESGDFKDVVASIQKAKKSSFARGTQTFDEVYRTLNQADDLLKLDWSCQKLLDEFKDFVLNSLPNLHQEYTELIEENLSKLILETSALMSGQKTATEVKNMSSADYQAVYEDVASLPGCNGGGEEYVQTGLGWRATESGGECKQVKCGRPGCGWKATAADITKIKNGELKCCPKKDVNGQICGWQPSRNLTTYLI